MPDTTEFDDLLAQLQQERPRIDPGFARKLDTRAAAGFPRRRRSRLPLPKLPRLPILVPGTALAAVAAIAITVSVVNGNGGGAGGASTSSDSAGASAASVVPQSREGAGATSAPARPALGIAPSPGGAGGSSGRFQQLTASMTLVAPAKQVADGGDRILGVANQVGGFVVSSDVRATDGTDGGGDFQLRVPAARLSDALARLGRLAHVRESRQGVLDITPEHRAARDRLDEANAERRSLLRRLGAATTDAEVTSLRARLHDVSARIAADRASLARVDTRARFASVSVSLTAAQKKGTVAPGDDHRWTPGDALREAGRILEVAGSVALLILAILAPLALIGAGAVVVRRQSGRRGRERMLDAV